MKAKDEYLLKQGAPFFQSMKLFQDTSPSLPLVTDEVGAGEIAPTPI